MDPIHVPFSTARISCRPLFQPEPLLSQITARHVTYISKVIMHPSKVLEVQIKKEHTTRRAGQYIFINCPEVSYFQYHPFTLTSAPEEDFISVHIRIVGDWTREFAMALGADVDGKQGGEKGGRGGEGVVVAPPVGMVRYQCCTAPETMLDLTPCAVRDYACQC